MENYDKKTGFVSLIGRPSAGKSTLINQICGFKVSIVSDHPQTTRFLVRGIYSDDDSQIVFIDTPGYHHHNSFLNKGLSSVAMLTLQEGDLILYVVDSLREIGEEETEIFQKLKNLQDRTIVVFNKVDKEKINNESIERIKKELPNADFINISALTGTNVKKLIEKFKDKLPFGPLYYPEEYVTEQSIPFRIEEIVREKVFENTKEEIPHSVYVKVIDLKIKEHKLVAYANIYIERESQKGILIGNKGSMIKKIGETARDDLKEIFEKNVDLFLKVKVHQNWKKNENFIKKMFEIT